MIAENLVKKFFYLYLNPRRNDWDELSLKFNTTPWDIEIDRPIYDFLNSTDLHLKFKVPETEKHIYVAELCDIFFKELNQLNLNIEIGFYNLIKSLLLIFYFPLYYANDHKSLVVNKAIALFQLSNNYPDLNKNDNVRTAYIKFLFYNAHLYEEIGYLKINKGKLYYKNQPLIDFFVNIMKFSNHSLLFNHVINYCISMIDFFEKGFKNDDLKTLMGINDIYIDYIFYNFFIEKGKPYKYKKMMKILFEMQAYPNYGNIDFLNTMFLFNFINLVKKSELYLKKHLNKECIDFIEINKKLSDLRYSHYFKI